MKENSEMAKLYRRKAQARRARAKIPVVKKLEIAEELRIVQEQLAPARAANKAKRAADSIEIRIKTA